MICTVTLNALSRMPAMPKVTATESNDTTRGRITAVARR
jgi:hypothetical protein